MAVLNAQKWSAIYPQTRRRAPNSRRPSTLFGAWAAIGMALSLAGCTGLTRQVLYKPGTPASPVNVATEPPSMVTAQTDDGLALKGYFWPGTEGDPDLIMFLHGRNWTASRAADTAKSLAQDGNSLLIASYRGFDDNPGDPTQKGLVADAEAFIRLAVGLGGRESRIWLVGHSLGAAVALHVADSNPQIGGVFLFSACGQLSDAVPRIVRGLVPDRWENIGIIAAFRKPVVIMQGGLDHFIPVDSGDNLLAHSGGRASLIVGTGSHHNPDLELLSPWLTAAIASMAEGSLTDLPEPPSDWIERVRRP